MKSSKIISALLLVVGIASQAHADLSDKIIYQGDSSITQEEFDSRISLIPEVDRLPFLSDGARVEDILRKLIMNRRIADEARKAGFDKESLIAKRIQLAIDKELANAYLAHIGMSQLKSANFELMAKEYYLTHKKELKQERSIDVSHILVSTEKRSADEALTLANQVYVQLQEDPKKWSELVKEYSEDPGSKNKDGQYLAVVPGQMVKPFEDVGFSLGNIGDISVPVETQFGYHIIRLDGQKDGSIPSFDEIKDRLISAQRAQFGKQATTDFISKINTSDPLVIPDCAIEQMMNRYYDDQGVADTYQKCMDSISADTPSE